MSQRLYETAVAVLGPDALLLPTDEHAVDGGRWVLGLLASRANVDHGRDERDPTQRHRRASARSSEGAENPMTAVQDVLDLVDSPRDARDGYPHELWTRLRAETP